MLIVPGRDPLTEPYWDGARQGKLLIQRCRQCAHRWHPPAPICPACQKKDYEWEAMSGRGEVFSFTVVHHAAHRAVAEKVPYLVALVTLDEGPRLVSNILDCPIDAVHIGLRVIVAYQEIAEGIVLPQFVPHR